MSSNHRRFAGITICYVSTEGYGGVWRTVKQARTMVDAGARVVIAGYEGLIPEPLSEPHFETAIVGQPYRNSTRRVRMLRVAENVVVNQALNNRMIKPRSTEQLKLAHSRLIRAVVATGADVIQAVDLPALDVAHAAAGRLGARLIYASHELWTGFVENPDMGLTPQLASCLLDNERRLIGEADLVTVTSETMAERLVEQYGIARPVALLNAPPDRVESAEPVHEPIRLVYHGGLSTDRNIDGLIRAMALIAGSATLDIHGFSRTTTHDALRELIGSLGLEDAVTLHGPFAYGDVVSLLKEYDVGVMAARIAEENFAVTLPNKIFDCMCAGLAVALNESPAVSQILDDVPFGITLDSSSPETIARDLGALIDEPERILAMKRSAVEASSRYWWPEQGDKLVAAVEGILHPN